VGYGISDTPLVVHSSQGQYKPHANIDNARPLAVLVELSTALSSEMQLEMLQVLSSLADASPHNQRALSNVGMYSLVSVDMLTCLGLVAVIIRCFPSAFETDSHPLHRVLVKIIETVGMYRYVLWFITICVIYS